jgi:hypothetical protein
LTEGDEETETTVRTLFLVAILSAPWAQPNHLNPAIGPAEPTRYANIRNGQEWKNPVLIIQADGVELIAAGISRKHVSTRDLVRELIGLSLNAWPYGRVVAQSDQSILPVPWDEYERKMAETRAAVAKLLKELDIKAEFWPSA